MRPDNLLIAGASNNGKTAIARRFLCGTQASEEPAAAHSTIPAALIQAPNGPRISHLLAAIRAALGQPPGRRETIAQQRAKTYRMMRAVGLRMLLINDLHDIRGGEGLASMLVQLREIGAVLGMSLGCFATREIAAVLRQDDQLANRFELMTLPRWQIEDPDYWQLLHTFAARVPKAVIGVQDGRAALPSPHRLCGVGSSAGTVAYQQVRIVADAGPAEGPAAHEWLRK